MACEESVAELSPQQAVNNFVAAKNSAARFGWRLSLIFTIRVRGFSAPAGPGLRTISRFNDFELIDRPAGRT
jgi:hypothetical protein